MATIDTKHPVERGGRRSDFHDLAGWLVGQGARSAKELAR